MSSLIEQAAKRLALLRQAGADVPGDIQDSRQAAAIDTETSIPASAEPPDESHGQHRPAWSGLGTSGSSPGEGRHRSRRVDIDLDALAAAGMVSPHAPRSEIADQYRVIKRPLLANAMGKGGTAPVRNGNLIMVTSALPKEGKTFTSLNLAISIATELDNTVMLVDADVARPSLLQLLGLPTQPGLLDILHDESVGLSSTLLRTNIDKLTLLPSGTPHPRATELLASEAMEKLLQDMAKRYTDRIIIFDSPPLLVTTESHVLASHMGQIVVVVEAEQTLQSEVMQALATIESCPVKLLVLNRAKAETKSGYSYGYGYALGYG